MIFRERRRLNAVVATASVGAAILLLAGCGAQQTPGTGDGKLVVVASTNVWGNVAQEVGGDGVDVQPLLTDPAADPHS